MTDKLDLDAIEARCNAATEGPWDASYLPSGYGYDGALFDRRFIAHSRQDIPALIAEVRRLRADVDSLGALRRKNSETYHAD